MSSCPRMALTICLLFVVGAPSFGNETSSFRLMSFNILHGGVERGQPLSQTAEVMKLADIVGVQETHDDEIDNSVKLAKQLGWHHFQQGGNKAVISRFPISGHTPKKTGVFIELTDGQQICLFNAHFPAAPYQPYQLLDIEYGDAPFIKTEREAIDWARRSRGSQLAQVLVELSQVRDREIPTFVTGDFNEPSHLDWTEQAARKGIHPIRVRYPTAKMVGMHGLIDAFRNRHPNELLRPGFTWTPLTEPSDTADHHDRIDFVFSDRRHCTVENCQVVGENQASADLVIAPWPSDHRAVIAEINIKPKRD